MRESKREYVRGRTTKKARPFVNQPMGETLRHSLESGVIGQLGTPTFSRQSGIRFGQPLFDSGKLWILIRFPEFL